MYLDYWVSQSIDSYFLLQHAIYCIFRVWRLTNSVNDSIAGVQHWWYIYFNFTRLQLNLNIFWFDETRWWASFWLNHSICADSYRRKFQIKSSLISGRNWPMAWVKLMKMFCFAKKFINNSRCQTDAVLMMTLLLLLVAVYFVVKEMVASPVEELWLCNSVAHVAVVAMSSGWLSSLISCYNIIAVGCLSMIMMSRWLTELLISIKLKIL